ncbi:MAG: phosphonopyruvate decarboxylase [Candidatus Cloacimonas sp.]|nr:phosphonopyruvate decarboxylase [Candidatus Cloacimonadota bacterium]
MIDPKYFYEVLYDNGVDFFTGVPDSLLKEFCAYISDTCNEKDHVICANEGNAVAMGVGSFLATGKVPLVYMQNSGLGNAINPLLSLADNAVYGIPMVLLIGWRGEPGIKDEPQHAKQGMVQNDLLQAMKLPYTVISSETKDVEKLIKEIVDKAAANSSPVAIVVKKRTFSEYKSSNKKEECFSLSREEAIKTILEADNTYSIVSTTGKTSRELYEVREKRGEISQDFLTVGSMGHSSSIAAGIALRLPEKKVMCIDGDGALLMHMGALPVIGKLAPRNFVHVIMNNQCHESVGGQSTAVDNLDLELLARAAGYNKYFVANDKEELSKCIKEIDSSKGPVFLEVRVKKGSRSDLGRPKSTPAENKVSFIKKLRDL